MINCIIKVVPFDDSWAVLKDGARCFSIISKELAEIEAYRLAREFVPSILLVRKEDGDLDYARQFRAMRGAHSA
jgi:hypothetical protein